MSCKQRNNTSRLRLVGSEQREATYQWSTWGSQPTPVAVKLSWAATAATTLRRTVEILMFGGSDGDGLEGCVGRGRRRTVGCWVGQGNKQSQLLAMDVYICICSANEEAANGAHGQVGGMPWQCPSRYSAFTNTSKNLHVAGPRPGNGWGCMEGPHGIADQEARQRGEGFSRRRRVGMSPLAGPCCWMLARRRPYKTGTFRERHDLSMDLRHSGKVVAPRYLHI